MSSGNGKVFSDMSGKGAADALSNQGVDGLETVQTKQVGDGLMMDCNCSRCGVQMYSVAKWGELVAMARGQAVLDTSTSHVGVVYFILHARCGGRTGVLINWTEIRDVLTAGVHARKVPVQILRLLSGFPG